MTEEPAHPEPTAASLARYRIALPGLAAARRNLIVKILQNGVVDRLAPLALQEVVGKAENLKTVAITDDPEIQLVPFLGSFVVPFPFGDMNLDEARQTSLLFDGSIDAR